MAEFMGVHELPGTFGEEDVRAGWEKYKASAVKMGLKPIRAHFNLEKHVAYCETEASTADEVKAAHQHVEIPLKDVIEIKTLM